MLTIRVRRQDGDGEETREFQEESITIGRHPDNHLVLAESTVSRKHARIEIKGGRYHITDLGSAHGLYIDKQRVTDQPLPEYCEVYVNPFVLHVTAPVPEPAEETALPPEGGPAAAPPEDEALQTLPADDPASPAVPIELDIEDEPGAELPMLGEHEDEGIIPLDADADPDAPDDEGSAVLEVGDVPGTIADGGADVADVADVAEVADVVDSARADEAAEDNSPDAAPENIVGTIFELNAAPLKREPSGAEVRSTDELPAPPDPPSTEFKISIDVDDEPVKSGDSPPSSEMLMAPATAITPAGKQSQAIDEGTVLEYSAKDVQEYADAVDAEEAHAAAAAAGGGDPDDGLGTLPRHGQGHSDGSVPRTRAHVVGPAAGPAAKATPELQARLPELVEGRDHGRLVALGLGVALVAMTLLPTAGAPVPAFMGGSGLVPFVWLAALFGGVAAIVGARLIPNPLWRGVTIALGGLTPLVLFLATFDAVEITAWLGVEANNLSEGLVVLNNRPGPGLALGWAAHAPLALWVAAFGSVLVAAAARIARAWPESRFPRVLGPVAGLLCLAAGLFPVSADGPMAYQALFAEGASATGYVLLAVPLAGVIGLLLAAGKGRVLTFVPTALLAIAFCSTAVLHILQRVQPPLIDQARLTLLPVPMIFLAATGIAAAVIAELTRRRPDAQELLDRL